MGESIAEFVKMLFANIMCYNKSLIGVFVL